MAFESSHLSEGDDVREERSLVERYHKRAAQLRAIAEDITDKKRRELLLKCARDYGDLGEASRILDRAFIDT